MILSNKQNRSFLDFRSAENGIPRRNFIKGIFGAAAATTILPYVNCGSGEESYQSMKVSAGGLSATDPGDEQFWLKVKNQFPIKKNLIMMNAANLCPSPIPVQKTLIDFTIDEDHDASSINRRKFGVMKDETRKRLAEILGADADEIVIVRNTTEGNNVVVNGVNLSKNDEVVIWDQNHPTNNLAWEIRAERFGFKVIKVSTPPDPQDKDHLIKPFRDAITRNTKVLAFSHVSNISGIALPDKALCKMARDNGILTLVDGAQTFGPLAIGLHDMGCDFYTGSADKWFCGPEETGVLYVRRDQVEALYPSTVGVGWESALKNGARKFETLGQRDDARVAAFGTCVEFNSSIEPHRIEARVRFLAGALKEELGKVIPGISFTTPLDESLSLGVIVFDSPTIDRAKALTTLYEQHNIGCTVYGGETGGIRLSPNIYNSMDEIDRVVAAVKSLT